MFVSKSVINSWARAISNIAIDDKKVDKTIEQCTLLIDVLKDNDEYIKIISVHEGEDELRLKMIQEAFGKLGFDKDIVNALKLIAERDLFYAARDIFKQTRKILWKNSDTIYGVAWSTVDLDKKVMSTLESKFSKKLNINVKLVNKIDETLLGGIQVVVNGENFDGSLRGKINDLKDEILKNRE